MRYLLICFFAAMFPSVTNCADVLPIEAGSTAGKAADVANRIWSVQLLSLNNVKYKIVSLDSSLNGDLNATTIILVGESVGGEAGYEAAFLITPDKTQPDILGLKSARVGEGSIEVVLSRLDGEPVTKHFIYDPKARLLKEIGSP